MHPPRIDERDSLDLVAQLRRLVSQHAGKLPSPEETQINDAMIHVFARFGEIVIDRLNRAPEKNLLAFLQLLGVSNLPPRAAKVPLTFYLAGGAEFATIPAHTQVAAQQLAGEKDPVLFETDRELVVVASRLASMFAKEGARGFYSDLTQILPQLPPAPGMPVQPLPSAPAFEGDKLIPHEFYIALQLGAPASVIDRLLLNVGIPASDATPKLRPSIEWQLFLPVPPKNPPKPNALPEVQAIPPTDLLTAWQAQAPVGDTTDGLTKSGEIVFANIHTPLAPNQTCWVSCRLLTPISSDERQETAATTAAALHSSDLPVIQSLIASLSIDRAGLPLQQAFLNNSPLDLSKDFYPFGDKPKFGDTLYLGSRELFSTQDATIVLHIEITNPANSTTEAPIPRTEPHNVKLAWEFWDGREWSHVGASEENAAGQVLNPEGSPAKPQRFADTTSALSIDGTVTLTFPSPPVPTSVGGQVSYWLRVRIIAGDYIAEAHRHNVVPAFAPPMIRSVRADYSFRRNLQPQTLVAYNDFTWQELSTDGLGEATGETVQPFQPVVADEATSALYFGFELPKTQKRSSVASLPAVPASFPLLPIALYLDTGISAAGISSVDPSLSSQSIQWQYWNGSEWANLTVRDDTDGFRQPGLVRFITPPDLAAGSRFACTRYWLRAVPSSLGKSPRIRRALLNTVMATGHVTYTSETLGVSNGMPQQSFALLHKPVLLGQQLEILEPRMPSRKTREIMKQLEGDNSLQPTHRDDTAGMPVWVRWHQVADFSASGPRDRHYLLESSSGTISFPDGIHGLIPPRAAAIRASYRTGGGAVTNRVAGNITQLKTAVPYVAQVYNWIAADSGGDAEDDPTLLERGSRSLRHGGRAVTIQDYEDLARLASPEVARARCIPLIDLAASPAGKRHQPGTVSLIVVPRSDDPRPFPGLQLLQCVQQHVQRSAPPAVQLSVVGPDFVRIDVTTELVIRDPGSAADIEAAVKLAVSAFLHPLTGGRNKTGWPFGRVPHKSDLYGVLTGIHGVCYVRSVETSAVSDRPDVEHTNRFLISPGNLDVTLVLSPATALASGEAVCR